MRNGHREKKCVRYERISGMRSINRPVRPKSKNCSIQRWYGTMAAAGIRCLVRRRSVTCRELITFMLLSSLDMQYIFVEFYIWTRHLSHFGSVIKSFSSIASAHVVWHQTANCLATSFSLYNPMQITCHAEKISKIPFWHFFSGLCIYPSDSKE